MWSRAWRFANVYAYAAVDVLFAILWFAASIAVGVWTGNGTSQSAKGKQDKQSKGGGGGSCSDFAYGSASKCTTSKASVAFGVLVFLTFAGTSAISIWVLLNYRKTGILPYTSNSERHGKVEQLRGEDPNKDAWDTNTDELDPNHPSNRDSDDNEPDPRRAYGQIPSTEEDDQGRSLLHRSSQSQSLNANPFNDAHSMTEEGVHPGRAYSYQSNTSLSIAPPAYQQEAEIVSPSGYIAPSALSPSDYEQTPGGRVNFPQAYYGADFR